MPFAGVVTGSPRGESEGDQHNGHDAGAYGQNEERIEARHHQASPWLTFNVAVPPPRAVEFIRTAAIGERTDTVNALSDHVVEAKWKADVALGVTPPLLKEFHTTDVEATRCKSSKVY